MTNDETPITIDHANGIDGLDIPVPRHGGLVVAVGENDIGKSQALLALTRLVTGQGSVSTSRGFGGVGTVSGLGMHVAAGHRTTRQGDLEVDDLTSGTDLGTLIAPERATADKRDAVRIKTLVRAVGAKPDLARFARILDPLGSIDIPEAVRESADPVQMAQRLKRTLEEIARGAKGEAEEAMSEVAGLRASVPETLDLKAPHDHDELERDYRDAVDRLAAAKAVQQRFVELESKSRAAAEELSKLIAPTDDDLEAQRAALSALDDAQGDARQALATAREAVQANAATRAAELERIDTEYHAAVARLKAEREAKIETLSEQNRRQAAGLTQTERAEVAATAERQAGLEELSRMVAAHDSAGNLQASIDLALSVTDTPTDGEIRELAEAVNAASSAGQDGARIRDALETLSKADDAERTAVAHQGRTDRYKRAAKGTDEILVEILHDAGLSGLEIHDGRLMTTDKDGAIAYDERSPGAQARLAFHWLVPLAKRRAGDGRPGILILEQRVYQELDYVRRRELAEWSDGSGVVVYSALATDGPLRVVLVTEDSEEGIR